MPDHTQGSLKPVRRLVCSGSSGGGKTTLAQELAPFLNLTTITHSRPTAAARQMGYQSARDIPPDQRGIFQWLGLIEQISAERALGDFIADRGVMDFAAYARYELRKQEHTMGAQGIGRMAWYEEIGRFTAWSYDAIILVPPNSNVIEDNGIRYTHGVQEVHDILVEIIKEWGLWHRVIELKTDTPQERAREVIDTFHCVSNKFYIKE